jgi:pimeloyl-ACP methyl ester carboxylesterase
LSRALVAVAFTVLLVSPSTSTHSIRLVKSGQAALPSECGADGARCRQRIAFAPGYKMVAYGNYSFAGTPQVNHAIIVVHGTGRNAQGYFAGMMAAANKAGVAANTIVLAPFFQTAEDKPGQDEARWTSDAWKIGEGAQEPAGLSSFAAMDDLVTTLADKSRFPNITNITIIGHSAGAQFAQRYAAFGIAPNLARGVAVNYVVVNPSSYVYLDQARPSNNGTQFTAPAAASCKYDDYKYGLSGRSGYVARLTREQVLMQYASRRITYVQGGSDTVQNGDMDTDCAANMQGPNRLARGANFFTRIRQLLPNAPQDRIVVPDVDHDHDAMFAAPAIRPVLFGA